MKLILYIAIINYNQTIICLNLIGQSCLSGFLSEAEVNQEGRGCTENICELNNEDFITRLVPDTNFTCNGRIIKWRAAGKLPSQTSNQKDTTKLRIWRKVDNQPGYYSRTQLTIALGVCSNGRLADTIATNVHECELANDSQVPVQAGDIVGLEIPRIGGSRRSFKPYFNTRAGPKNYDFNLTTFGDVTVSLSDPNATTTRAQLLLSLRVITTDTMATTSDDVLTVNTTESPVTDVANNVTNIDSDGKFVLRVSIMTVGVFAGLALMALIIIILILALACSVRKNKKLKKQVTMNDHRRRSLGDNINSSMEMILNDSTGVGHVTSAISMEENIAYNKRRRSDGYEYVINELVYASVEQCDRLPEDSPASNAYLDILDNTI